VAKKEPQIFETSPMIAKANASITGDMHIVPDRKMVKEASEYASNLVQKLQIQDYANWKVSIQKIRDTYAGVIKVLEDKEAVHFSIAFFKVLSIAEDLDQQIWNLSNSPNEFPNTGTLKFLYKAEKVLDEVISIVSQFKKSYNHEIQYCAIQTENYFEFQKALFLSIRDIDYRNFKTTDMPDRIPPEVIKSYAKFLEQREQMTDAVISLYSNLADKNLFISKKSA
jgi:hypothetical protein